MNQTILPVIPHGATPINSQVGVLNDGSEWTCLLGMHPTYHSREHSTLGMKPIDRFGLDLSRIRYLAASPFGSELFLLESTRKVRADNNLR